MLFDVGDSPYPLVVVLSGRTEIIDRSDGGEFFIKTSGPGEFDAELGLLTGQAAFAASIVREAGEVLLIPQAGVQEVIATIPAVGDAFVTAFSARRQLLMRSATATLTLIGPENSSRIERLQEFTTRNLIPFRVLDPADEAAGRHSRPVRRARPHRRLGPCSGPEAAAGPEATWNSPGQSGSTWQYSRKPQPISS